MRKSIKKLFIFAAFVAMLAVCITLSISASAEQGKWITAWGSGMTEVGVGEHENIGVVIPQFVQATFRSVVSPTASGSKIRIKLSNVYGQYDLTIKKLTVAKSTGGSTIDADTAVPLYFNSKREVTIPAGKEIYSDPIEFQVEALDLLAISTYFSENNTEIRTCGFSGGYTYLSIGDDFTAKRNLGTVSLKLQYSLISVVPVLSAIDVYTENKDAYSVVVIGDSTVANEFPYYLAKEINNTGVDYVGIVGKGIIGNSLLSDGVGIGEKIYGPSLMSRFKIDALSHSGVKYVVVKLGCNDIVHPKSGDSEAAYGVKQPTAAELIEGYKKLAKMCHDAGIKIVMVPITQWKGYARDFFGQGPLYTFSGSDWEIACEVNDWMLSDEAKAIFDDVVNLNEFSVSENDPAALNPAYSEDGCHPNDTLQLIWANKFNMTAIGVPVIVKGVSLNKAVARVPINGQLKLKATISPKNATNTAVKWSSGNNDIATVSADGVVTGVSTGLTLITCETEDGGYKARCIVSSYQSATDIALTDTEIDLYETQTYTLKAVVYPDSASVSDVTWESDDTDIATVSSKGIVTAVNKGKAVITCKTTDGGFTAKCEVRVAGRIPVEKVSLNVNQKTVVKGKTYALKAEITPADASNLGLTWKSSNKTIATVSSSGVVTAKKGGKAIITCSSKDNGLFAVCSITVRSYVEDVALDKATASVYVGRVYTIKATCSPSDASNKKVTWSSSSPSVAVVSSDGVVTALKAGTATITATAADGKGASSSCKVTVKKFISVTRVTLNSNYKQLKATSKYTLKATVAPSNASVKTVKWKSSNTKIAKVSSKGVVTAIAPGSAVITCTSTSSTKRYVKCTINVVANPVKGVSLNKTSMTIAAGNASTLAATVSPSNATYKTVTWTSSNTSVAKVSSTGKVTAIKPGTCKITAKTKSGGYTAVCKVKVTSIAVTGVSLSRTTAEINAGTSFTLKPVITPANASNKKVIWSSLNPNVATVSSKGVVKGVGVGTTLISCKTVDGSRIAICIVKVNGIKAIGIKLNATSKTLSVGSTFQIVATVMPTNATNKSLVWSSNATSVAKVSSNGLVTAVGRGTAKITVKTTDGTTIANCTISVV